MAAGGEQRTVVKGTGSKYVKLNVGGELFYTTIGTLTKQDNMLRAMFSGRLEVLADAEGWVLIDRCGKHFGAVLNFLRDGTVPLPETKRELLELQTEAKYYLIQELVEEIEVQIKNLEGVDPICRVPLLVSPKEEQAVISSTTRPVVKLLCNRHNNKYSYTTNSDDHLLKNVELFEKLCLRFHKRILFIKDVNCNQEICCWSFYGHGQKITEVCCTSIVYGMDKKHTKVEFPEAKIYEETLNVLLYENRERPDEKMMMATRINSGTTSAGYASDDEVEDRDKVRKK